MRQLNRTPRPRVTEPRFLSFSVGLECESLFFGRRSPDLPVRLPCPLHISLAVANPGKDLRDVQWRVEQQLDDCGSARSFHILHITCSTQCLFYFGQKIAMWLSGFVRIRVCSGYGFLFYPPFAQFSDEV